MIDYYTTLSWNEITSKLYYQTQRTFWLSYKCGPTEYILIYWIYKFPSKIVHFSYDQDYCLAGNENRSGNYWDNILLS